jgi:hypothetical protein
VAAKNGKDDGDREDQQNERGPRPQAVISRHQRGKSGNGENAGAE